MLSKGLVNLRTATNSAADLASLAETLTYESANGQTTITLLGRPYVVTAGRSSVSPVMFLFPTRNLRDPSADRRETLPHDRKLVLFYNRTSKIRGLSPKKLGAKNMQNFGRFYTISDFDREYLQDGLRHPKSER